MPARLLLFGLGAVVCLVACGGGSDTVLCESASAWNGQECRAFARRREERVPTPFVEGGRAVSLDWVRARPDVLGSRLLSAGSSRGGILAVVHAGQRPGLFQGVVNFVGGWLGEGCTDAAAVNRSAFVRGASFDRPTLWLYGENDSFYSPAHSRGNFDAFLAAGGEGTFRAYKLASTLNGHFIIGDPALWTADLAAYVESAGR